MILEQINGPIILDIPTDPASLFLVRGLVERLTGQLGFEREEIERMVLAVDEACTNVIRHAYGNRQNERIVLTFIVQTDRVEFRIRDFGTPADPSTFKPRDLACVGPGGLGLYFMNCAMDEVRYERPNDGGTLLRMSKFRIPREVGDK